MEKQQEMQSRSDARQAQTGSVIWKPEVGRGCAGSEHPLLRVEDLTITFPAEGGERPAVSHLGFTVGRGEIVGVVGESGSGKSMTALAVMGLLPPEARTAGGHIFFRGEDLLTMTPEKRRSFKGSRIAMVFQEPMTSLNPVLTIGNQVAENLKLHREIFPGISDREIRSRVVEAMESVGLPDAETLLHRYPHELSGGMRQRVMLAMAAVCQPDLIIADEPTTALDVVVQAQILALLRKMNREKGISILFISHDLQVVRRLCRRTVVVYRGAVVEEGLTEDVMLHPKHDYTKKLIARIPVAEETGENTGVVLSLNHLHVYYEVRGGFFKPRGRKEVIHDMSFNVHDGEILGIVGESGCGKSTLSKAILGLHPLYEGDIRMKEGLRPQMIFQDPFSSLNPARKLGWLLQEPLRLRGIKDKSERRRMVEQMLTDIGLDPSYADRYPRELSGGQRQRISIGSALLMDSRFIIADEPVSALDVMVQSQILKLLLDIHREKKMTMLFISHDLEMVRRICRRVLVLYRGEIVEAGRAEDVYEKPVHPYTRMLLAATRENQTLRLTDSLKRRVQDAAIKAPEDFPGCPFYPRCAIHTEQCARVRPPLVSLAGRHVARCIHAGDFRAGEGTFSAQIGEAAGTETGAEEETYR